MNRKDRIDGLGAMLLIFTSALMGANQVMVKVVNGGLQPVFQAGLRSACAFLPVLCFALLARRRLSIHDGSLMPGILVGVFFGVEFLLLFLALDYTTVSRASIFFYTMPFWTAVAAHFLIPGERLSGIKLLGLGLAIAGVAWALGNRAPVGDQHLIGDLFCLAAAAFWSGIVIVARTTRLAQSTPEMQLLYQLAVSSLLLLPIAPLFGDLVRDFDATIGIIFAVQVLVVVCLGFLVWFWVLSKYPASDMASFSFLSPVLGVLFGWLFLSETIDATIIGALALVSAGVYLVNRKTNSSRST